MRATHRTQDAHRPPLRPRGESYYPEVMRHLWNLRDLKTIPRALVWVPAACAVLAALVAAVLGWVL